MWCYEQSSGKIYRDGLYVATGYAGQGDGKNNPDMQDDIGIGPIPRGNYRIGPPTDTATHGPFVMALTPDKGNQMFGRSGFLIHGDSVKMPGTASHGCIIMARAVRETIWNSGDRQLVVTAEDCHQSPVEGVDV